MLGKFFAIIGAEGIHQPREYIQFSVCRYYADECYWFQVINNLHIAHLELRTESCIDVAPYSHARMINSLIVQLGPELTQLRHQYVEVSTDY